MATGNNTSFHITATPYYFSIDSLFSNAVLAWSNPMACFTFFPFYTYLTDLLALHGPLDGPVYEREWVYSGYDYQGRLLWRRVSKYLDD